MTSTNFNIGLPDGKNSSRVLKPPGGGHSDIFGIKASNETQTPSKRRNYPTSTIGSCFVMEENTDTKKEDLKNYNINGENGIPNKDTTNQENGLEKSEIESKENNNQNGNSTETDSVPNSKRGRVPPGGFSTPLW